MQKSQKRFGRCTVYGAVSNVLRRPVFSMAEKTDGAGTLELLKQIKANLTKDCRPFLIFDGHSGHKNNDVKAYMDIHFRPLLMPPSSCMFNVTEYVWRLCKTRFRE